LHWECSSRRLKFGDRGTSRILWFTALVVMYSRNQGNCFSKSDEMTGIYNLFFLSDQKEIVVGPTFWAIDNQILPVCNPKPDRPEVSCHLLRCPACCARCFPVLHESARGGVWWEDSASQDTETAVHFGCGKRRY
jgi:hypothetical protein